MVYGDIVHDPEERKSVVKEELGVREDEIPERVVVTPIPFDRILPEDFEERLREDGFSLKWMEVEDPLLAPHHGNLIIEKDGRRGFVAFLGRGLIDFTERIRLISLIPHVKDILFFGSAGSLDPELRTGFLNIPSAVVPFEDISTIYVDATRAVPVADENLHSEMMELTRKTGIKTFDISTIDMEVSSLYRIARFHGKRAVAVLRASDLPLEGLHFFSKEFEEQRKEGKGRALEAFLQIALGFFGF